MTRNNKPATYIHSVNIKVSDEILDYLEEGAEALRINRSLVIRGAIKEFLERHAPQIRLKDRAA